MRHGVDGRKLGRNTSHRIAMYRNMANSVITSEQIITTVQKAKEVRRVVDRLVTLGKSGTLASRRLAFSRTRDKGVVEKLFGELAKRYEKRPGGYTRVLKTSDLRRGDAAQMAVLELVDHPTIDRRRKVKPATESAKSAEGQEQSSAAPVDPFGRFRKMFSSKKQAGGKASGSHGATGAAKRTPAKKPQARSSSKSGG